VLPIGGVKEKVLAASRFGLTTVILPKRNEGDLEDVPEAVRAKMNFIFAERVEDVVGAALTPVREAPDVIERGVEPLPAEEPDVMMV
jgi:ATP-dependent Lon protease